MNVDLDRYSRSGQSINDTVAMRLAAARRKRLWRIVICANIVAFIAVIAGCLFLMPSQGILADVSRMRDEVGESLTMMTLGGASEAAARYLPHLIDTTKRWDRKFAAKSESFRGMDAQIDQVQAMHRLGETAERWLSELEGVSPMQRNEIWQKSIKAQIDAEQMKWPNRTHKKGVGEFAIDICKEFWYGAEHGLFWPYGIYVRAKEAINGKGAVAKLGIGDCLHYVLFPYRLSTFTFFRLAGIALATSLVGYLLCWIGLKSRIGWLSYTGLIYFVYMLIIALFIVWLEVTK